MSKAMYIHVPFCDSICAYCDFERCKKHPILVRKWLDVIVKDIKQRKDESIETLYIGGGTPSCLSYDELDELLCACDCFSPIEYTIEANVENLTSEKIDLLVTHHVNRISLGVQALDAKLIQLIDRHHCEEDIFTKIDEIHEKGIHNISVDMIYALPHQTLETWLHDLKKIAKEKHVSHLSIYSLTIEPNSSFGRKQIQKGDDELEEMMYFEAIKLLKEYGFEQYEISNFARCGQESQHNQMYWKYEDFIGIGCGAYGKENHVYYHYPFRLHEYVSQTLNCEKNLLSPQDECFEMIMMGLRMKRGIALDRLQHYVGKDDQERIEAIIKKHMKLNNLEIEKKCLRCTSQGFALLNSILIDFMEN